MKYINAINTAEEILEASSCEFDSQLGWYFILYGKLDYRELTNEIAEQLINETLGNKSVDWFDDEIQNRGDIEINGKRITVYFEQSQAIAE